MGARASAAAALLQPVSADPDPDLVLDDSAQRARLSGPGLRTFFAVVDELQLGIDEQCRLLGGIGRSTCHKWRADQRVVLARDQLERVSLVLGIYKALRLLFVDGLEALRWLKAGNHNLPFAGRSPLERMLLGSIDDLYAVRRYLDAWPGVW
jgi:hypothetical protein